MPPVVETLLKYFDPLSPVDDMRLYVEHPGAVSSELARRLLRERDGKYLLVGGRGGGTSTELRRLAHALAGGGRHVVVTVDLDASGISAASVSAFDLLYLSSVAILRGLAGEARREGHFEALKAAYVERDAEKANKLGSVADALDGLAEFAGLAAGAATALGGAPGIAPAVAAVGAAAGKAIRLYPERKVVDATSPKGRELLRACTQIVQEVRAAAAMRQVFVVIDGLEKMNGEAPERFHEVFVLTRLLLDAPFAFAIAAPPSTLTSADGAGILGYSPHPVLGFVGDGRAALRRVIEQRVRQGGLELAQVFAVGALEPLIEASGGLPRHLVQLVYEALIAAPSEGPITTEHAAEALRRLRAELNRGLDSESYDLLAKVRDRGELPSHPRVAGLFASSQVLAHPPNEAGRYTYRVHPLLMPALEEVRPA